MKKLIPVLLAFIGLGGGAGAGLMLRPAPEPEEAHASTGEPIHIEQESEEGDAPPKTSAPPFDPEKAVDYVKMPNQFIVPLMDEDRVGALVVASLSIEVEAGTGAGVLEREPKLRDMFLQVFFRHAQSGSFDGMFTAGPVMRDLRESLLEAAQSVVGPVAQAVLVTDIVRQDL